jgi:hypothetical protein
MGVWSCSLGQYGPALSAAGAVIAKPPGVAQRNQMDMPVRALQCCAVSGFACIKGNSVTWSGLLLFFIISFHSAGDREAALLICCTRGSGRPLTFSASPHYTIPPARAPWCWLTSRLERAGRSQPDVFGGFSGRWIPNSIRTYRLAMGGVFVKAKKKPFDVEVFLSKADGGRVISKYGSNEIIFSLGGPGR